MPQDFDNVADVSSRFSSKRLWLILGLIVLGIVVLVPIIAWKSVFETPPTEAELEAGIAENAKHVVPPDELDPRSVKNQETPSDELRESRDQPVSIQALSLDELETIAAEGELVLYTFRGESVTWKDMTGVPFAESLQAARRVDQSIPAAEHNRELAQLGHGMDFEPGVSGRMSPTATIGEYLINSQIFGHIQRGWAHCVGKTFVSDHAIDLTQRIDFAIAEEAVAHSHKIQQGLIALRQLAANDTVKAEEFYGSSPLLQEVLSRADLKEVTSGMARSSLPFAETVSEALMPYGSLDHPSPPMWFRYEWESCFHRIAAVDQAAVDPSLFVPMVEEREAPRTVIRFAYYAPHERAKVETLVSSFLRPDRRVDVARAESFHRSRSAISLATFLLTDTNAPIKEISTMQMPLSTARSMWKGIGPGTLLFERSDGSSVDSYGFVYLGEPLLGSSGRAHEPLSDYVAGNNALEAIGRDSWRKLKDDFHTNTRFYLTPHSLTAIWHDWSQPPGHWKSTKVPFVKEVPA